MTYLLIVLAAAAALFAARYVLLALIRLYQWTISPLLGPVCKYYPSCSHYGFEAVRVHGALKGSLLTAWRILRCNPWSVGGVDHVPARRHPVWYRRVRRMTSREDDGSGRPHHHGQPADSAPQTTARGV